MLIYIFYYLILVIPNLLKNATIYEIVINFEFGNIN